MKNKNNQKENIIKSLFSSFLILAICTSTHAQSNKFDIGVEGGPSLIFLRGNDVLKEYHKPTIGYSGGLFFQYNFKKIFSLRTNIAYERKGSTSDFPKYNELGERIGTITINTNYDYLTLPILVRATFGEKVKFIVNAGPYFGYLLKQTFVSKDTDTPIIDNTDLQKRFDTGISTGLGLLIPVKTKFAISLELRNNLGLYNVSATEVYNDGTIKTNSTNFLIGFTYKFGQRESDSN